MPGCDLHFARAPGDGKVEIQDPSAREAAAFQVVPDAKHPGGDAEILGYRFDRIASAYFVVGGGVRVGAGIDLLAGGDGDDETGFGRERRVFRIIVRTAARTAVKVVGFGDGLWSRVIGAGNRGQCFSTLHLVITPPDALVGWNRGDGRLKFIGGSGGQVQVEFTVFVRKFRSGQAQQAGVEVEQVLGGGIHALGG